jgi:hypothetical protein
MHEVADGVAYGGQYDPEFGQAFFNGHGIAFLKVAECREK